MAVFAFRLLICVFKCTYVTLCASVAKQRAADTCWNETPSVGDDAQQYTTWLRRFQRILSTHHETGLSLFSLESIHTTKLQMICI